MTNYNGIFIKNVYYMLSYAYTYFEKSEDEYVSKESFDNIHDLFAAILAKGISRQLKQGLFKEYLNISENLAVVRGKIEMPETISNQISKRMLLACNYDELSENNLLNQILKTTVMILIWHAELNEEYKDELKKEMLYFSNVDFVAPRTIKWTSIRFHRNNQSYRVLIGICQLIIEGMLLTNEHDEYKLANFINDKNMNRLYEKFILEYYNKEHKELKVSASQISWALDDEACALLPIMQTDIMLKSKDERNVLIIDAKFYGKTLSTARFGNVTQHSNNLYQIFTYVKNETENLKKENSNVSGMLLYAQTIEEIQPDATYSMSGNKISVKTLNLNVEFKEIAKQLDDIAETLSIT